MAFLQRLFRTGPKVTPTAVRTLAAFRSEVLESSTPVIVDVWSETCAPCKQLVPVLVDVATRYEGRVRVVEVSVDAEPSLLAALKVRATPTLIVFAGGEEFGRSTGFRPGGWFDDMIAAEFPEA